MGTPDFAQESLERLYEKKYNIVGVFTAADRPKRSWNENGSIESKGI